MERTRKPLITEDDIADAGGYTYHRDYIVKTINEKISALYDDAIAMADYYTTATIGPSDDGIKARQFIAKWCE